DVGFHLGVVGVEVVAAGNLRLEAEDAAMLLLGDGEWVGGRTTLSAQQGDVLDFLLEVGDETRLQHDGCAVVEADEGGGEILDREVLVVPLAHEADDIRAGSELLIGDAAGGDRLRMAHEPERQVEHVDADVYQRATALLALVNEDAPAGDAPDAQ